jgi:hypothetical protein
MKRIIFLLICIIISFGPSFAQGDGSITFNDTKHDFGVIYDKGGSGQQGSFLKSIVVHTNQGAPITLQISGEVTNAAVPKKPEGIYPVALENYRLKNKNLK